MSFLFAASLAAALPAAGSGQPTGNLQLDFDAATEAANSGECEKALTLFASLERDPDVRPGSLPAGAIAIRKGLCLFKTGRYDEGETAILAGLPIVEKAGKEFEFEVADSYKLLGNAAYSRWDYADARRKYEKSLALNSGVQRLGTLSRLVSASMFDDGAAALEYAEEGLRLAPALDKSEAGTIMATFHTMRGRTLLNLGRVPEAYADLKEALDLSGGLTSKTTLNEVSMRSDLSLAALLMGRRNEARRYLAYTGAGRITESPFASAISMDPPGCGAETGLNPDDFAVVEFGIADDGSVSGAQTVYSRGGPKVAAAFARAVSEWYGLPESLAKIPPFYRLVTRVELRCSTAEGSAPGITKPISDRFTAWSWPLLGIDPAGPTDRDSVIEKLRGDLALPEQPGGAKRRIAMIGQLALLDPRRNAQTVASLDHAIELAGANMVPVEIVNCIRIMRLLMTPFAKVRGTRARIVRVPDADVQALIDDPAITQDALAASTVRLLSPKRDNEMLAQVANDTRLPEHHPLRQVALLALANEARAAGDMQVAHQYFERTGLTEEQCALIGMQPEMKRSGASSADYPNEALAMGFEGWVNLEFDITADGKTADARAVIAYPPFVFVNAASKMAGGIRYASTYRPEGGVACNAQRETIKFILGY